MSLVGTYGKLMELEERQMKYIGWWQVRYGPYGARFKKRSDAVNWLIKKGMSREEAEQEPEQIERPDWY